MSDSRLAKIEEHHGCHAFEARNAITSLEAAGLLVIDPDDDATIERAARHLSPYEVGGISWREFVPDVRAILAALRGTK